MSELLSYKRTFVGTIPRHGRNADAGAHLAGTYMLLLIETHTLLLTKLILLSSYGGMHVGTV